MSTFAQRLTRLRESRELKKTELADILNVSTPCISQYERGDSMPGYDIMLALSEYFGVSVDYLLGNSANLPYKLDNTFYNDINYHEFLVQCSSLSPEHRRILLGMIDVLNQKPE